MAARDGLARTVGTGLALAGGIPAVAGLVYFIALRVTGAPPWPPIGEVMVLPYLGDTLRLRALAVTPAMLACVLTAAVPFAITRCGLDRAQGWCSTHARPCRHPDPGLPAGPAVTESSRRAEPGK